MSASRIFSVAAVAAFASFAAQADTYGAHFQDEVQSTRTRAEVQAEAAQAVASNSFKNFVVEQKRAPSAVARATVRAEAVTAARAGTISIGNRG